MTINPGAAEFPHRQIAAQLRARIHRGDWAPGERLPSIPTLATQFGVAKQTVQRTIDQLRIEGLLITRPGSGTFVRGTKRRMNRLSRGRYGAERGYHAELAARYRQHLMQVGVMPCPADVAEGFGIDPGVPLLVRRHLVRTGDAPVEVGASWFRPADVRGTSIERPDVFDRPSTRRSKPSWAGATPARRTRSAPASPPARRPSCCRSAQTRRCWCCCTSRMTPSTGRSRSPRPPGQAR